MRESKPMRAAKHEGGFVLVCEAVTSRRCTLRTKERFLAMVIGRFMGRNFEAFPTAETLTRKTGLSRSAGATTN